MGLKTQHLFKLITREDPANIHKILGLSCLFHFMYQYYNLFTYGTMDLLNNTHTPLLMAIHGALSLSSFIFRVPLNRHKGSPMIYQEFRLHSIIFALRSGLCVLAFYYRLDKIYNIFIVNITMVAADVVTSLYKADTKTMRGMPFGKSLSEIDKRAVTHMHSSQQFAATLFTIMNIESAFSPMLSIQLAAFLMTLVRKSIISELDWHRIYAISLWINIFVYWSFKENILLAVYVICGAYSFNYCRIGLNYNKYFVWNAILFAIYFVEEKIKNYDRFEINEGYIMIFINLIIIIYLVKNINKTKALWRIY